MLRIRTDVDLAGQTADATVFQDDTGDGSADSQESVTVDDGINIYELDSLSSSADSYWVRWDFTTTSKTDSPTVNSVEFDTSVTYTRTANVWSGTSIVDSRPYKSRVASVHSNAVQMSVDTNPMFRQGVTTYALGAGVESARRLIVGATDTQGIVVPQDEGTGLDPDEADWMSAGHFAGMLGQAHNTDYVEQGLNITADWDAGTFSISDGLAYFEYPESDIQVQGFNSSGEYDTDWSQGVSFTAAVPETTDLTFREGEVTEVWLTIDQTQPNLVSIEPTAEGSFEPDPPNLLIAKIDPQVEEVKNMNRGREVFPKVTEDPNDVAAGEAWYRKDIDEFRASLGDQGPIVKFDTTGV